MKKNIFSLFVLLSLVSCQKEEIKTELTDEAGFTIFKKDWMTSKLDSGLPKSNGNTICYLFSKSDIKYLQASSQLKKIRFVLGLTDGRLDLKMQGVGIKGSSLGVVNSIIDSDQKISRQLLQLASSKKQFISSNVIINQHLLNPALAFDYIKKWDTGLVQNKDLNATVSYDNVRINYFSIEREIIDDITKFSGFEHLGVLLGVNLEGKLTTVLLGLDKDGNFAVFSDEAKDSDDIPPLFDFTKPCPNTCN